MKTTEPAVVQAPPAHSYFADLYTFDWTKFAVREPGVGAIAVAVCLVGGVVFGHPSGGLIAGGGAMTVGFGTGQRIAESRVWPMIAATLVMCLSTFVGMIAGHHGYAILLTATLWGLNYGLMTALAPGVAWVGQQAAVTLFVASAFPASPEAALLRALLILLGGTIQIVVSSSFLRLLPELGRDLRTLPAATWASVSYLLEAAPRIRPLPEDGSGNGSGNGSGDGFGLRHRVDTFLHRVPHLRGVPTFPYALRMGLTVLVAAETYRRLGMQSGYWVPMTALLVQKPAFAETFNRALLRMAGTLVGAGLATFCLAHLQPQPMVLAVGATVFAFAAFCTVNVNYGLFSVFLTTYIVFLLSLNTMPGPVIAHRRTLCTIAGAMIAIAIHLDELRSLRRAPTVSEVGA